METKLKMAYWEGDKFWVGKLLEHPEIMTQGEKETPEELEENMKDAYMLVSCQRYSVISKESSRLRNLRFLPAVEMTVGAFFDFCN